MIYIFDELCEISSDRVSNDTPFMKAYLEELNKTVKGKRLSILSRLLLQYALFIECGIEKIPQLVYNQHGKPFFRELPNICFNISNCKKGILCGISAFDIGVDIQDYVTYKRDLAQCCLAKKERVMVERSSYVDNSFTELWTLKESYGKFKGTGILYDMSSTGFKLNRHGWYKMYGLWFCTHRAVNYVFSVCSKEKLGFQRVLSTNLELYLKMHQEFYE